MLYTSTRDKSLKVSSAEAITRGISPDGGLFVPCEVPEVSLEFIESLKDMSYKERAKKVLALYLTDFSSDEISGFVEGAYKDGKFSSEDVAPVVKLHDNVNILELWHGPTCAFKDMALQLLPHLLIGSSKKTLKDKEIVILVATSGDTGKAALEGFRDVDSTKILVFYPEDGVSPMQKRQMCTQEGNNVGVCAINGNFDDAQTGVKAIFTDEDILKVFDKNNLVFSSANSINWGRLVPQIVYYFSAYCDMMKQNQIQLGDKINFVVPTGNFGNILAAYYAMKMGLPINRLICASNANNVLTDFITTGKYNKNRDFYTTISPSMDILISSNLERLIFLLHGEDDEKVRSLYASLKENGTFEISEDILKKISDVYSAGCCDDNDTKNTIRNVYEKYNYLSDTHTAVAIKVCEDYRAETGDLTPTVIDSTASPYKFAASVLSALTGDSAAGDEFDMVSQLEEMTGVKAPEQLRNLKDKKVRFSNVCEKDMDSMRSVVFDMLGIE
ncbi:MAG: threonine synthase [Clostridiales bacterium]|nr:threonine synthase [Clostridiales bacterium]